MTEEKTRRMVTGTVVGVTTLILALLAVLVWQIVTICVQNNRMAELAAEETRLEQDIEAGNQSNSFYASEEGQKYLTWQYIFQNNGN